jgi:hypothetical protein
MQGIRRSHQDKPTHRWVNGALCVEVLCSEAVENRVRSRAMTVFILKTLVLVLELVILFLE